MRRVDAELLLSYNHFSIHHEGNNLTLEKVRFMSSIMNSDFDWKMAVEGDEFTEEMREINQSDNDLKEARNHIFVSFLLPELSKEEITDALVRKKLHKWIMSGLLGDETEGLAGEYRKCSIGIEGSTTARPLSSDVPPLMRHLRTDASP